MSEKKSKGTKAHVNRKNAARSTGPKTPEGKQKVSRNAVTHGLLSKEVFIRTGDGRENPREFRRLMQRLHQEWQPVGAVEEFLVGKIGTCMWRNRRPLRCETGVIRSGLDNARYRILTAQKDGVVSQLQLAQAMKQKELFRRSSLGVRYLLQLLDKLVVELENGGCITSETQKSVSLCFGPSNSDLARLCAHYDPSVCVDTTNEDETVHKGELLEAVDSIRSVLEDHLEQWLEIETMAREAKFMNLHLPDESTMDKILRYETAIERKLYKAIAQLLALQERRKGE